MEPFVRFLARFPEEHWPKLEQAINDAAQVLADPKSTDAQYKALADDLENLQHQIGFDSTQAAADAWKGAIEQKLTENFLDQGMSAGEASAFVTPKVNELLSLVESFREMLQSPYIKAGARWARLKIAAVMIGAGGLLSFAVSTGMQQGNAASGIAEDLHRKANALDEALEFSASRREYDKAMNSIRLSASEFQGMIDVIVKQPLSPQTAQPIAPQTAQAMAPLPRAIAQQPIAVTVDIPNQQRLYANTTVGDFVSAMPSPQREQTAEIITKAAANEAKASASVNNAPRAKLRRITVHAPDGHGQIWATCCE